MAGPKKKKHRKAKAVRDGSAPVELTPTEAKVEFVPVPPRAERSARGIHPRKQAPPVKPGTPTTEVSTSPDRARRRFLTARPPTAAKPR
jgi:hypothetical protein